MTFHFFFFLVENTYLFKNETLQNIKQTVMKYDWMHAVPPFKINHFELFLLLLTLHVKENKMVPDAITIFQ